MSAVYISSLEDLKEYLATYVNVDDAFAAMQGVSTQQDVAKWFNEKYGTEGFKPRTPKQAFTAFFIDLKSNKI